MMVKQEERGSLQQQMQKWKIEMSVALRVIVCDRSLQVLVWT